MIKIKKFTYYIIFILALSILINIYFTFKTYADEPIVEIDDKIVLTKKQLNNMLSDTYSINVVSAEVNNALLEIDAQNNSINKPNKENLEEITNLFPSLFTINDKVTDLNRNRVIEAYYTYQLFKIYGVDASEITNFLESDYGMSEPILFKVRIFNTTDHKIAVNIEKEIKDNKILSQIEQDYGIQFQTTHVLSMENLITNHHNNDSTHENISEDTKYNKADFYHIMEETGDMSLLYIEDILTMENNKKEFDDLYFSKNYMRVKSDLINELKSKYTIHYND